MIINCTLCGADFNHDAKGGRPPGFCSDECREHAKRDPMRICRGCHKRKKKSEFAYPAHCSDACRNTTTERRCMQCGGRKFNSDRFCSGECVAAHYGERNCLRCGNPVPIPVRPPYNVMPRFCSETCRMTVAHAHGHTHPKTMAEALRYQELITYAPQPLWTLPTAGTYRPFVIPVSLLPDLYQFNPTAKLCNSIAWWNHCIPVMWRRLRELNIDPWLVISLIGRTGWGGADTLTGVLPLYVVLPYLGEEVLAILDIYKLRAYWDIAAAAKPYSQKAIDQRKEIINRWLVEYDSGTWQTNATRAKFFKATEEGSSKFIRALVEFQAMHGDPVPHRCYTPDQLSVLYYNADVEAMLTKLDNVRKRNRTWRVADYSADPPMPVDRTMHRIDQLIEEEHRRLSRER